MYVVCSHNFWPAIDSLLLRSSKGIRSTSGPSHRVLLSCALNKVPLPNPNPQKRDHLHPKATLRADTLPRFVCRSFSSSFEDAFLRCAQMEASGLCVATQSPTLLQVCCCGSDGVGGVFAARSSDAVPILNVNFCAPGQGRKPRYTRPET